MASILRINLITDLSSAHSLTYIAPFMRFKARLNDYSLVIKIHNGIRRINSIEGDVCIIDGRLYRNIYESMWRDKLFVDLIHNFRRTHKKVFWLDTTDSSGTIQRAILPHVDTYLKSIVLYDKKQLT